ncbi:MAG: hypothetical protein K1X89_14890, partial [Myxococcaceae bacterium]|nr:hypothetical protein [Myxococcaceae bacterium]
MALPPTTATDSAAALEALRRAQEAARAAEAARQRAAAARALAAQQKATPAVAVSPVRNDAFVRAPAGVA